MPPSPTPPVTVEALGTEWIDGGLYVRTVTRRVGEATAGEVESSSGTHSVQLVLRERGGDRTVVVPTVGTSSPNTPPNETEIRPPPLCPPGWVPGGLVA